jgi:hypothetical protein
MVGRRVPEERSLEDGLRIDRDDLDSSLTEQPDQYYKVALAYTNAAALRDAAKLDLEQIEANLDVTLRAQAAQAQEKTTEASIKQEMRLDPRWQTAKKHHLDLSLDADRLGALKEAFQQRSFMLRELVALTISEIGSRAGAAGAYEATNARQAQEAVDLRSRHLQSRRQVRRTED